MRTSVVVAAICVVLATGCGATPGATTSPSPAPTASPAPRTASPAPPTASPAPPTASPAPPTASPAPATPNAPEPVQIEPSAVIDLAGTSGAYPIASDGQTVWTVGDGELLRIDAATNAVERLEAPVAIDDTTLAIADDGLWATRWQGSRLYRLDPATGAVLLEVPMAKAVRIAFVGEDLWVGREDLGAMFRVDRETGEIDTTAAIQRGGYGVAGLGDLWFAAVGLVLRIDPATGDTNASIAYPGETNCSIGGSFPDNVWTACFGRDLIPRSVARIDPATNSVAAVAELPPTHGGTVIVIDGRPWFVGSFDGSDGLPSIGLLRLDPQTGAVDRFFSLAGADPDSPIVSDDALWIPDEYGRRLLKVDFAQLGD